MIIKRSVRTVIIAIVLAFVTLFFALLFTFAKSHHEENTQTQLRDELNRLTAQFDKQLLQSINGFTFLASTLDVAQIDSSRYDSVFDRMSETDLLMPAHLSVDVANNTVYQYDFYDEVASGPAKSGSKTPSIASNNAVVIQRQPMVNVQESASAGRQHVTVHWPIDNRRSAPIAVLSIVYRAEQLERILDDAHLATTTAKRIELLSPQGNVAAKILRDEDGDYPIELSSDYIVFNQWLRFTVLRHEPGWSLTMVLIVLWGFASIVIVTWFMGRFYQMHHTLSVDVINSQREMENANTQLKKYIAEYAEQKRALLESNEKLEASYLALHNAQNQLIASEKLAAIGEILRQMAIQLKLPIQRCQQSVRSLQDGANEPGHATSQQLVNLAEDVELIQRIVGQSMSMTVNNQRNLLSHIDVRLFMEHLIDSLKGDYPSIRDVVQLDIPVKLRLVAVPSAWVLIFSQLMHYSFAESFKDCQKRTNRIDISVSAGDDCVVIDYRDNGICTTDSEQESIFYPVFDNEKTTSLFAVYQSVVKTLRGTINVERSTTGLQAVIRLPILDEELHD